MARAIAKCTCKKCGEKFDKIKWNLQNRSRADEWKEWAVQYFDICPECWKKEKTEKLISRSIVEEMHYRKYKNNYSDRSTIPDSYNPKTKTIMVIIKTAEEIAAEELANLQDNGQIYCKTKTHEA